MKIHQGLFVLDIAQIRRGRLPAPFFGFLAGGLAHFLAQRVILQGLQFGHKGIGITGWHQITRFTIANEIGNATGGRPHDGDPRGHTFQHDKAQRFGIRRHAKDIGRGKGGTQVVARQLSGKDRLGTGEPFLQFFLLGSLADNGEARVGHAFQHGFDVFEPFFRAEPSHVDH